MMDMYLPGGLIQDSRFKRLAGLLLVLGLCGVAFYSAPLVELFRLVLRREGSSHGVFVPLLSLCFVWWKRSSLKDIQPKAGILAGLGVLGGGLLLAFVAKAHGQFYWECVSFVVVLFGLVICFFGMKMAREFAFPIFFLIAMIPVPESVYGVIADWARQTTIRASTEVLTIAGIPFFRDGLFIHLPNGTLRINIGCSGIRYLFSYLVFGIAYAYLYRTRLSRRLLLVSLTIPISLLASTLRLTAIALLTYYVGPHMAEYRPHIITSWLVFVFVLAFFVGLDRLFVSRKEKRRFQKGIPISETGLPLQ